MVNSPRSHKFLFIQRPCTFQNALTGEILEHGELDSDRYRGIVHPSAPQAHKVSVCIKFNAEVSYRQSTTKDPLKIALPVLKSCITPWGLAQPTSGLLKATSLLESIVLLSFTLPS